MTKIKIDDDVEMLTDKQLKINILKFLNDYKDILVDKIQNPKVYNDAYIKKDINRNQYPFNLRFCVNILVKIFIFFYFCNSRQPRASL